MNKIKLLIGKIKGVLTSKEKRRAFILSLIIIGVIGGVFFYLKREARISIENSAVSSPLITVSPEVSGKLLSLSVNEGDQVSKGDNLAIVGGQILRADTDGEIVKISQAENTLVSPQTPLITMINPSDFRVVGTLDENKGLKDIKSGQVVQFSVDAYPGKTYWGYVDHVAQTAKSTQLSFSISSERPVAQFEVYVRFDARKYPEIKNGMSAKMAVYTKLP